jgi:hypothetical protein
MSPSKEVNTGRKPRQDKGLPRFTERDIQALKWIGEHYALRFDQLQRLLGSMATQPTKTQGLLSETATRHAVQRWQAAGLVEYRKVFSDDPGWVWLTGLGLRTAGLPFSALRPGAGELDHIYWCAQVRLSYYLRHRGDHIWETERYLRQEMNVGKKKAGSASIYIPDARITMENLNVIALQVELTAKTRIRLEKIVEALALEYTLTWYVTRGAIADRVREAIKALDDPTLAERFKIYDLETISGLLPHASL